MRGLKKHINQTNFNYSLLLFIDEIFFYYFIIKYINLIRNL